MVAKKAIESIAKEILNKTRTQNLIEDKKAIKDMIKKIELSIKKNKIDAKVLLGGSAAKGTFIGNDYDIDIFIMFNYKKYKDQNENLSKLLKKILKGFKAVMVHGSRDYYQINKRFEIIPVLHVKNPKDVLNVTDASPLHVKWVESAIKKSKNKNIQEDIKLTKLFFKSCQVYGAESYIKGFSGHVTDILTIYYGSFLKTIEAISKWKNETKIDIENHKTFLDISKTFGPLTIIDPVQPNRNAAAALGTECYNKAIKSSKAFLKKPNIKYFEIKEFNLNDIKKKYNLIIKAKPLNGKQDIVGAKLMKSYKFIKKEIKLYNVKKSGWYWDKNKVSYFYYNIENTDIPKEYIQTGPKTEHIEHVKVFKAKYKNAYLDKKEDRWFSTVKRKITNIKKQIIQSAKDEQLKYKVGGIEIVK